MTKQFEKALLYATRIHGGQFRKKTRIPYIAHILGVTAIALEYGANETESSSFVLDSKRLFTRNEWPQPATWEKRDSL